MAEADPCERVPSADQGPGSGPRGRDGRSARSIRSESRHDQVSDTEVLGRAFDRLVPDKRAILVLHYHQHESVATIAGALGIPQGTVKWRLSKARAALGRALLAEGEDRR